MTSSFTGSPGATGAGQVGEQLLTGSDVDRPLLEFIDVSRSAAVPRKGLLLPPIG